MKLKRRGFFAIMLGGIAGLYAKYMGQAKANMTNRFGPPPISVDSLKPGQFVQWGVLEQIDSPPEIPQAQLKPGQYIDKCEVTTMMPIASDDGLIFNVKYAYVIGTGDDRRGNPVIPPIDS